LLHSHPLETRTGYTRNDVTERKKEKREKKEKIEREERI
jgi:hypothetical protein